MNYFKIIWEAIFKLIGFNLIHLLRELYNVAILKKKENSHFP